MGTKSLSVAYRHIDSLSCLLFTAEHGLYRLTIESNASKYDWKSLYLCSNLFGNVDPRTGPWDFNLLDNNRPLLPAYWVWLDGKKLGLWYVNRPSVAQIQTKRFKGELGFKIQESGKHELRLEPYQPFEIEWDNVLLEHEWEDTWEPQQICEPAAKLFPDTMPQNILTEYFHASVNWAKSEFDFDKWGVSGLQLPIQIAAWHWLKDKEALQKASAAIEYYLSLSAWGNQKEDGYGHNGDMGAAKLLCGMAVVLRWLPKKLEHLRNRLIEKIKMQGNLFLEQTLLHRGHWGGAILQDNGYQSLIWFATAAYICKGLIENAEEWLAFIVPRTKRCFAAMPTDGVVAATNYHTLATYIDHIIIFRELHLLATGIDVYQNKCISSIPSTTRVLCVSERSLSPSLPEFAGLTHYEKGFGLLAHPSPLGDLMPYDGAVGFFAQMSDDADAQWLLEQILCRHKRRQKLYPFYDGHLQKNWLWAMLFFRPKECNKPPLSVVKKQKEPMESSDITTDWFKDSGVAALRLHGSLVVSKCGAPTSLTSYKNTTNCTDRMCFAPLAGNFVFIHKGRKILHGTNSRYRIRTLHGNVLLVDGRGQRDDIGMPMSQPDAPYYGEKILGILDNKGVEMDITPAYDNLLYYTRTIGLSGKGIFWLQDRVMTDKPRQFTWLFHSYKRNPWQMIENGKWELCVDRHLYCVEAKIEEHDFTTGVRLTPAVWSFPGNDAELCHHLAIEPIKPVTSISLSLRVTPG